MSLLSEISTVRTWGQGNPSTKVTLDMGNMGIIKKLQYRSLIGEEKESSHTLTYLVLLSMVVIHPTFLISLQQRLRVVQTVESQIRKR